ncbi:hypothetical protein SBA6_410055 [Candidatus Sulfopaludibacter sp. SbA6]|nr:hypothetical protein SBA6_410055 [Candidatus Sulfopaludibacter sp. SbA6]
MRSSIHCFRTTARRRSFSIGSFDPSRGRIHGFFRRPLLKVNRLMKMKREAVAFTKSIPYPMMREKTYA